MCIPALIWFPTIIILLVIIGFFEGKLNEKEILLRYYRQPGVEITATEKMSVHTDPVCLTLNWYKDSGILKILSSSPDELVVLIPEESDEWMEFERETNFVRSVQLYNAVGHKNLLLKIRK
jgi:hypothetical protein